MRVLQTIETSLIACATSDTTGTSWHSSPKSSASLVTLGRALSLWLAATLYKISDPHLSLAAVVASSLAVANTVADLKTVQIGPRMGHKLAWTTLRTKFQICLAVQLATRSHSVKQRVSMLKNKFLDVKIRLKILQVEQGKPNSTWIEKSSKSVPNAAGE